MAEARHKPPLRPWLAPVANRLFGWTENGCEGASPSAELRFPDAASPPSAARRFPGRDTLPPRRRHAHRRRPRPGARPRLLPQARHGPRRRARPPRSLPGRPRLVSLPATSERAGERLVGRRAGLLPVPAASPRRTPAPRSPVRGRHARSLRRRTSPGPAGWRRACADLVGRSRLGRAPLAPDRTRPGPRRRRRDVPAASV